MRRLAILFAVLMSLPGLSSAGELLNVTAVSTGFSHTCARTSSGGAKCWGDNSYGQLGNGGNLDRATPSDVFGLTTGVSAISASDMYTCALMASGGVKCWGINIYGQLGDGTTTNRLAPVDVIGVSGAVAIDTGPATTCAALVDGSVKCWGLSLPAGGVSTAQPVPTTVPGISSAASVSVGSGMRCVITTASGVQCWTDAATPVDMPGLASGVVSLDVYDSGCAATSGGTVKCWTYPLSTPFDLTALGSDVAAISLHQQNSCAVTKTGAAKCWGDNVFGDAGDGSANTPRSVPSDVGGLSTGVVQVSAGYRSACALLATTGIRCWGGSQLGPGVSASLPTTISIPGASQTISFPAIANHAVADAPFTVTATASSGLPVTFSSLRPAVCTVSGSTVTLVAPGVCTLAADQGGNDTFSAARHALQSFPVLDQSGFAPPHLQAISTRMQVEGGQVVPSDKVAIAGFIIGGTAPKTVLLRAKGPSLNTGNAPKLSNPFLDLLGSTELATNGDWAYNIWLGTETGALIQAMGMAPTDPAESAILATLPPGAYTAIMSQTGTSAGGVGLVEVYEVDHSDSPFIGISTRGQVLAADQAMIGGFIISGNAPQTVVVRARGPSLTSVSGTLADPVLQLVRASDNTLIATNDDWGTASNAAQLSASGFAPSDSRESALLMTLDPGAYTAIVSGAGGTTGVAIVEVYAQ